MIPLNYGGREDLTLNGNTISTGGKIINNGKIIDNTHFSDSFKDYLTNRTAFGRDNRGNCYLFVVTHSNFNIVSRTMLRLGCTEAWMLDGGSSSWFKKNNKYYLRGKNVVNYIVGD